MKIFLVLLSMLAAQQWFSCEASRKTLEKMEAAGNQGVFAAPKLVLLESVDEGNEMETEVMLPDESDDEKPEIIIEEEKKRSQQQKDAVTEAIDEQTYDGKKHKKHQGDEASLSEIGDANLLFEETKEEKWVGDKPKKKKRTYNSKEASDSSALLTDEAWQEEGVKAKKERATMNEKVSGQPSEDNTPANAVKGDVAEGFSGEASLAKRRAETDLGDFLLDSMEVQDGSAIVKEETQDDDAKAKSKTKKVEVKGTSKPENLGKEESKHKTSDGETSIAKEDEIIENKEKKGGVFEGSKSKISDGNDLTGKAIAANEQTSADLAENETKGIEDLVTSGSKVREGEGGEQQMQDDGHTGKHVNANETEEEKDKEKPMKKLKAAKKPKIEVLQDGGSELKGFDAKERKVKMKAKKKTDFQLGLIEGSDVTGAKTLDLQSKRDDKKDTAKSQVKKKKKINSNKLKKEETSNVKDENNFDVFKEEEFFGKANEKSSKKLKSPQKEEEKPLEKAEKTVKESTDDKTKEGKNSKQFSDGISEAVDHEIAEDISSDASDPDENHLKRNEEDFSTIEEQEEKLELEVQGIAKEVREEAEGSITVLKSVASSPGVDEEDGEDYAFMQDFSDLSTKFQDTALKVADHLGPNIQKLTDTSKTYFNKANEQITESFSPLVGKKFAPFFASLLSCSLLLIPLAVVIILFEQIRAMLSLQKILLFVNIYLAAYFATLLLATFIMGEPMTFFYRSSASGYVHLQLLQALGYIIYLILQTIDLVSSCSSEACSIKVTVVLQWFVAVTIGFHYYVTIFHRAMALKGPHTNWKIYGVYSCAFLVLCFFARIKKLKKGYVQVGQADTGKKH